MEYSSSWSLNRLRTQPANWMQREDIGYDRPCDGHVGGCVIAPWHHLGAAIVGAAGREQRMHVTIRDHRGHGRTARPALSLHGLTPAPKFIQGKLAPVEGLCVSRGTDRSGTVPSRLAMQSRSARPALVRSRVTSSFSRKAAEHAEAPGKNRCLRLSGPSALEELGSGRAAPLQ